mmetsp:Transcript_52745/g.107595  ORF Transcript_52745/g.107595 Transcript_52745/m.107595 type:complete len:135 (-) Transcript_52745:162-566(-)|eukprot:CAMPEP_0181313432 /NCGR_PEP_ID=MMETSP1101-20121128/14242_1 /TAXON_ID=46948 /ORGANISM="Rhodomonas abbreviata, Strain Caron Lab Isolate" /LENGTH=134 /DNA_ID=CAMNT_0023420379 /DNA_START=120 /DNA_END=524 /DNA_ORIENTATION=+
MSCYQTVVYSNSQDSEAYEAPSYEACGLDAASQDVPSAIMVPTIGRDGSVQYVYAVHTGWKVEVQRMPPPQRATFVQRAPAVEWVPSPSRAPSAERCSSPSSPPYSPFSSQNMQGCAPASMGFAGMDNLATTMV